MTLCMITYVGPLMRQYAPSGDNGFTGSVDDANRVLDPAVQLQVGGVDPEGRGWVRPVARFLAGVDG